MPTVHRTAIVPYSALEMFHLVDKIEDYPEFISWCDDTKILFRNEDTVEAELTLSKNGIKKSFATRNLNQPGKMIEMRLLSGPFKHLHGFWQFETLEQKKCKISFDLEFEFLNKFFGMMLSPLFMQMGDTLIDTFQKRAQIIYG